MRRWNPTNTETILWASGAALLGSLLGFGICRAAMSRSTWTFWVIQKEDGYIPYIQDEKGAVFELSPELTEFGAKNAAQNAIRERGGRAVEGRPLSG